MTCAEVRELLSALVDEAVSAAERQAIETHLATCVECRQELAELDGQIVALRIETQRGLQGGHGPGGVAPQPQPIDADLDAAAGAQGIRQLLLARQLAALVGLPSQRLQHLAGRLGGDPVR